MEDSELYDKLYCEVKNIIKKRKIDKYCLKCSKKNYGCCHDCIHLGKKGCKVESLTCALWFCMKNNSQRFLTISDLITLSDIERTARSKGWLCFRGNKQISLNKNNFNIDYDEFKIYLPIRILERRLIKKWKESL